ncbi:MAG: hypothetical protein V4632_05090 [Pseudomonadota bacterium]
MTLGWISGHTIKHLLATAAAGALVARTRSPDSMQPQLTVIS